jgi:type I restriction enzyme, S subunit
MARVPERPFAFFRLSPDERRRPICFAVRRGDTQKITNPHVLFSEHYGDLKGLEDCVYPLGTIGQMLAVVQDGLHGVRRYVPKGVPLIGVGNITEDGIDLSEVNQIAEKEHERLVASQVRNGDLLVTITGRLGTGAIFNLDTPANLSAHVALCRAREGHELGYLKHYLVSRFGAASITKAQVGSTHPHINVNRLAELPIPIPPQPTQVLLAEGMDAARAKRREMLDKADELLSGMDDYLFDALGMKAPARDDRRVFAVTNRNVGGRFDPHFHSPPFAQIQDMLSQVNCLRLGDLASFSAETWSPDERRQPTFNYIEIGGVSPKTGQASWNEIEIGEAPSRARMLVREGDIIVSLTRPHHGSIACLDKRFEGSVASTGFAVLRAISSKTRGDYLWCVLRASFCLRQMQQRASGGNYPAITEAELANVLIPIPALDVQSTIALESKRRRDEAQRLRAEAEAGWDAAKAWFEEQLLGPSAP